LAFSFQLSAFLLVQKKQKMSTSKHTFENLVFEGGGVKGSAYAGCVEVLDQHNLLAPVKRVAGTSAGSITATMLAIGAGSKGLTESIVNSDFHKFIYDPGWIFMDIYRVFRYYGIHSGDSFVKILKNYLIQYTGKPDLTFAQLQERVTAEPDKYKELSVVASNISTQQIDVFNAERTPDVPIWQAVRCSMSIPLIFKPFNIGGNLYVDGGLGWVYPIDIFDEKTKDGDDIHDFKTLGFYLEPPNVKGFKPSKMKVNSLKSAFLAMADFLYNSANAKNVHPEDKKRTVFVNDLGVSGTNFDISAEKIQELIVSGRKATEAFLQRLENEVAV